MVAGNASWTGRLQTAFADDRSFWPVAAAVLGLIAFAKGIQLPNLWGATQAMANYDHGIVKRGLYGATFGHWFHLEHYVPFTIVSIVLLLLLIGLITWLTIRSGIFARVGFGVPVVVFVSSYAVTFLASLIGYLDIPLAVLTVAILLVRNMKLRFLLAVPACIVALLIHELFLFIFLPVILFSFLLDGLLKEDRSSRMQSWAMCAVLFCLSGAVTVWVAQAKLITPADAKALYAEDAARADFAVTPDFFSVLTRTTTDNLREMKGIYASPSRDALFLFSVIRLLPVAILLILPILAMTKTFPEGVTQRVIRVSALVAALSPLFMHLLGWDSARWNSHACLTLFLVLLLLTRSLPAFSMTLSAGYRNAAILVIAISMATGGGLFEGQEIKTYPFATPIREMLDMMRHGRWAPPRPIDPVSPLN